MLPIPGRRYGCFTKEFCLQRVEEPPVRRRQHAMAELLLDHVALRLEVRLVDVERSQPLGLGPEQRLEVVRRDHLVVVGDVVERGGVVEAADVLGQPVQHLRLHVLRALEHHVLEEMREPAPPLRVILGADAIPDMDGHRRRGPVLDRVNLQSIRQHPMLVLQRRNRRRRPGGRRHQQQRKDQSHESHVGIISGGGVPARVRTRFVTRRMGRGRCRLFLRGAPDGNRWPRFLHGTQANVGRQYGRGGACPRFARAGDAGQFRRGGEGAARPARPAGVRRVQRRRGGALAARSARGNLAHCRGERVVRGVLGGLGGGAARRRQRPQRRAADPRRPGLAAGGRAAHALRE